MMKNRQQILLLSIALLIGIFFPLSAFAQPVDDDTLMFQNWESGWGSWQADNGVWEVGNPTVGPDTCFSPFSCAGTILNGNYPNDANTRLISPQIHLPILNENQTIKLKFRSWARCLIADNVKVQIQVGNGVWVDLASMPGRTDSPVWSQNLLNLTSYSDSFVRIGFLFTSNGWDGWMGWYIDNICLTIGEYYFNNPEDFESGVGDWSASNGIWEIGVPNPSYGLSLAHSGINCAGTILNGNYTDDNLTKLISPIITLNGLAPELFFWHWFRMTLADYGYVQIKPSDGTWVTVGDPIYGNSSTWTQSYRDLSAFAGRDIQIAFYFTSNGWDQDNGWYIDDVRIEGIIPVPEITITPVNPPIFIPANGGSFQYNINVHNPATQSQTFMVWNKVKDSVGNFYPVWGPVTRSLPGGANPTRVLTQNISGNLPSGGLVFISYLGSNMSIPVDSSYFGFYKLATADGGPWITESTVEGDFLEEYTSKTETPEAHVLMNISPNPFNPTTTIRFDLPQPAQVTLEVFDINGRVVGVQHVEPLQAGSHEIQFDGSGLPSGVYIYRLTAGVTSANGKMVLLK
ncbi:MAG: choice-of-anchor J domain-containing protein [bacterium]|nr:choice-of-anchor J domain-containing protein [bacterium]